MRKEDILWMRWYNSMTWGPKLSKRETESSSLKLASHFPPSLPPRLPHPCRLEPCAKIEKPFLKPRSLATLSQQGEK